MTQHEADQPPSLFWKDYEGRIYEVMEMPGEYFHADDWSFEEGHLTAVIVASRQDDGLRVCLYVDAEGDHVRVACWQESGTSLPRNYCASGPKQWHDTQGDGVS